MKVFIKCDSFGGVKNCLYVSLVIFVHSAIFLPARPASRMHDSHKDA